MSEQYIANRTAASSYSCTYARHTWNGNQAVKPKFQDKVLLPCLLFISTAFCQDLAAGIKGGNTCLDHADERICFVLWGFCISVLWPQSHSSINHTIHFKEQVWPCSLLSSGTAVDTTCTEAWQSFKIYLEVPWSFKIGLGITNRCLPAFWRHTELHGWLYSWNPGEINGKNYFL